MAITLAILSVVIVVFSMYGVLWPHSLIGLVGDLTSGRLGLWSAVSVRLLFAVLLWLTAPVSHTPHGFKAIAVLLFLSAIGHAIVGRARLRKLLESLASWPPWAIRLPCLLGVAMGVFIIWSISSAIGVA